MSKCYNFLVPLVVYPFDIMFSIGQTDEELKKSLEQYNIGDDEFNCFRMAINTTGSTFHNSDTHRTLVRLKSVPNGNRGMGLLAHEVFHAVDMILRDIQITLSADSDEAYAYLLDYVTVQFWNNIKPTK